MSTTVTTPSREASLPEQSELEALVASALEQAQRAGASAAEAGAGASQGLSVSVRRGEVQTLEHMRDRSFSITVYFGQRKGSASSGDYGRKAIAETVQAACDIARYTSEDRYAGLADPELMARDVPDLDLHHPWALPAEEAIALARECEAAALAVDRRLTNSEGADVSSSEGLHVYGNSHGFVGAYAASQHGLSCVVLGEQDGAMQRDYWYTSARNPAALESAAAVGHEAGQRTVRRLGARRVATAQVPVLFTPETARTLIGHFIGAISGGALYRKSSFLLDSLGQPVFPTFVRMREAPHMPAALGSAPFDSDGVATRDRVLVDNGVLQGYVLSSYSARRLGMQTTGNAGGVHNLIVEPGDSDFEQLVQRLDRGLIVTHLMGQGANTVTGDYSRGASGFWVENGEIVHPVEEVTVAGNLKSMLRDIRAVGRDVDVRGRVRTGSLLVDGMTVAGE
jgi:PmbA protein